MREGWTRVALGDICEIRKGQHPLEKTAPGQYPLVGTAAEWRTSATFDFVGQAVCIPMVSSTGHGHASLKRVHFVEGEFAVANIVAAAVTKDPRVVDGRYLHAYLQTYRDRLLVTLMQGTANVSLKIADLVNVPVDLPPLDEQRRIVDLIGSLDATINMQQQLRASANRAYRAAARDAFGGSPKRGWPLGEFCEVTIGRQRNPTHATGPNQTPYLRSANVKDGNLDLRDVMSMAFSEPERAIYGLEPGDVLVTEGCGSPAQLGASASWQGRKYGRVCFQNTLLRLRARPGVSAPEALIHVARYLHASGEWRRIASGTNIFHIGVRRARELPIVEMSIGEQADVSRRLDALSALEAAAHTAQSSSQQFRAALLGGLLSGRHEIPPTYDRLLEAA